MHKLLPAGCVFNFGMFVCVGPISSAPTNRLLVLVGACVRRRYLFHSWPNKKKQHEATIQRRPLIDREVSDQ